MKYILPIIFTLFSSILHFGFSQSQIVKEWELIIPDGSINPRSYNLNHDKNLETLQLNDGTLVTLMQRKRFNNDFGAEIVLVNFDNDGAIKWEYVYESEANISETGTDITLDVNGDILLGGKVVTYFQSGYESSTIFTNYLLVKVSSSGDLLWKKELGSDTNQYNMCTEIDTDEQGNVYTVGKLSGVDTSSTIIHKYDSDGIEIWSRGYTDFTPRHLKILGDKMIVTTYYERYTLDLDGDIIDLIMTEQQGRGNEFDDDGNFYRYGFGEYEVTKFDPSYEMLWTYTKESNLPNNVTAQETSDIAIDSENNVYTTGRHYGDHYNDTLLYTNCDILTTKLDSDGNLLWENLYKYDGKRSCQVGKRIKLGDDGKTYVLGYQTVEINGDIFASDDMVMLVYNDEGILTDSIIHNGSGNGEDFGIDFIVQNNSVYLIGYSENSEGLFDNSIVKYSLLTSIEEASTMSEAVFYPNPSSGKVHFNTSTKPKNVRIYNSFGKPVTTMKGFDGFDFIDLSGNPPGMYFMTLEIDNKLISKSIFLTGI